jgi:hypothetical protein
MLLLKKKMDNLPLSSLEWDFWNHSISKSYKKESEIQFNHYINLLHSNIDFIIETEKLSRPFILNHLKKFWNEAVRIRYKDMHVNRRRFEKFRKKMELNKIRKEKLEKINHGTRY